MRKATLLADSVLALIEWQASEDVYLFAEPYSNGRERGWAVRRGGRFDRVAVFSEFRNTDQIVVYRGGYADFSMAGNVPSDEVYSKKKFFSCTSSYQADEFILKYLSEEE